MLMSGFPPEKNDRVTLANWQEPPYSRWAFSHMRELVPTHRIGRGFTPSPLFPEKLQQLGNVAVQRSADGSESTFDSVIADTYTDAVVVIHDGQIVLEQYFGETRWDTPHLLMSVTKSLVGSVAGNLVAQGLLNPDEPLTRYIPELENSGYNGATVRNVLDMRSGIKFSEEYTDLDAEVRVMEEAFGWRPATDRDVPRSIYEYLPTLERHHDHGEEFKYRSCETLVLGWACERAAGRRMADLISEFIWEPMGAEWSAEITCDSLGTAIHDGGMCATARDLARFGVALLNGGKALNGNQIVPQEWVRASWSIDPDIRDAFDRSENGQYLPGGWYRNQFWFLPRTHGDALLCLGINGQMLYVQPGTGLVAAKLSSWPEAQAAYMLHDTVRAFDALGAQLAGLTPIGGSHEGPAGIAAGLSR